VVAATPERPKTPTEPQEWQLHPPSENVATSHWPKIPNFAFADDGALPAPSLSDLDWREGQSMTFAESDRTRRPSRGIPLPREAPWPRQPPLPLNGASTALPVPGQSIFEIQEGLRTAMRATPPSRYAEQAVPAHHETISTDAGDSRRAIRGKPHLRHARQAARRGTQPAAHARHGTLKHLVQVRKRSA
jgi:hypothetical protein